MRDTDGLVVDVDFVLFEPLLSTEERRGLELFIVGGRQHHPNLRAAMDRLYENQPSKALRMALDLTSFLDMRGYRIEARHRLTHVLAAAPSDDPSRGRALVAAGRVALKMGEPAEARALLLEGLSIVRREGDQQTIALALTFLGGVAARLGDEGEMVKHYEDAIATARAGGDDWALAVALNWYSSTSAVRRHPQRARPMVEESLSLHRRVGDGAAIAASAGTAGEIALDAGDLDAAEKLLSEALDRSHEIGHRPTIAWVLAYRAPVSLPRDDIERGEADLHAALDTGGANADGELAADALSAAGTIAAMRREPSRAAMPWAAADTARGPAPEHECVARLGAQWQPQARAGLDDQASWDAATHAGADLMLDDALALAAASNPGVGNRPAEADRPPLRQRGPVSSR